MNNEKLYNIKISMDIKQRNNTVLLGIVLYRKLNFQPVEK